jgi:hypothetical protein
MTPPAAGSVLREATALARAIRRSDAPRARGVIGVSGVLADQLARELGAGAEPGAVRVVDEPSFGLAVLVRVIAGVPSEEDRAVVATADRRGVPVVLVQVWPQAERTAPYVLSPFVVECRAGEGFPISEIALRLVEAVDGAPDLAAHVPAIREVAAARALRAAVLRSALLGLSGRSRSALTREQLRLAGELRALAGAEPEGVRPTLVATAGAVALAGFALRAAARSLRRVVPAPIANASVAAAGTWALASAVRRLGPPLAGG